MKHNITLLEDSLIIPVQAGFGLNIWMGVNVGNWFSPGAANIIGVANVGGIMSTGHGNIFGAWW